MTIEMLDPNDTGDIPRIDDLGDEPTRNLAEYRTEILGSLGHLRDATGEQPTVDRLPETIAVVEPFAIGEWDNPVDTARLTILGSLGEPDDLSTPPASPPTLPKPPRPSVPPKQGRYVGKHRAPRVEHPVRGLAWLALAVAIAVAVAWWMP